jgi:SPP1 gp7 family putative phage head morphogenesis protein
LAKEKPSGIDFKSILNSAEKAFKTLHNKGKYKATDLKNIPEYKALIQATADVFSSAIGIDYEVPESLKAYLNKDVFVFSGLKTHAQLSQAKSLLKDENGNPKPYHLFEKDILKLNQTYNKNYLEAEYLFARHSAQSASNWANFEDNNPRYALQYRTAADERVRSSHAILNNTTLPKDDPFWDSYTPQNGWRCRCHVVEVLAKDYKASNPAKALTEGEKATTQKGKNGKNKLEMFRFNAGKEKVVFPPKNSYTKVIGATEAKKVVEGMAKEKYEVNKTLNKPRQEQFKTIFEDKSGGKVIEHLLAKKSDDYPDILASAKALAKQGKIAEIMPEINEKEKNIRKIIFPNLQSKSSNPDLKSGNDYFDIKRPSAIKNFTANANKASKQGAIAIMTTSKLDKNLDDKTMKNRANGILKNNFYRPNKIYFYKDNALVLFIKTGEK